MNQNINQHINTEKFRDLDPTTKQRYIDMLEVIPEPDWKDSMIRTIACLNLFREYLCEQDTENTALIPVSSVVDTLNQILTNPEVAGAANRFLEHNKQAIDIIALEQMMANPNPEEDY